MLSFGMMPTRRRSSDSIATPCAMALFGVLRSTGWPSISTVPVSSGSRPNTARTTSLRPAPMRPASPTISPARISKLTSSNISSLDRPVTLKTVSPIANLLLGVPVVVELATDHLGDHLAGRHLGAVLRADHRPVAEHR